MPDSKQPDTLTNLCAEHAQYRKDRHAEDERHKAESARLDKQLADIKQRIAIFSADLDLAKVRLAEEVMELRGSYTDGGEARDSVIRDAIDWFATGECAAFRGMDWQYFGTKDYDRWHGQRADCSYGMGPSHGYIVFSIGLKQQYRAREGKPSALQPEHREACLYYLMNIGRIEKAKAEAQAA